MKPKRYLLAFALALVCICLALTWGPTATKAEDVVYEVRPQGAVPYGYGPEPSRLVDLLERVLIQNQRTAQHQLDRLNISVDAVAKKLDKIEKDLSDLSTRIAGIETALGIKPPPPPAPKSPIKNPDLSDLHSQHQVENRQPKTGRQR